MRIVTARELGEFLKLTESTIHKLASTGELPGIKVGDSWKFDMDEVFEKIRDLKGRIHKEPFSTEKNH